MSAEPALSACGALVRRGDPDRFLAAMLAPPEGRERLFALYAFNLELARIPSVVSEPMLGLIRLQWWRDAVAAMFEGGPDRAHEVAGPLAAAARAAGLPRAPFERLLAARARDVENAPPATRAELDGYLADTGGALLDLAARALSPDGGGPATADAGFAFAAANLLRAAPALIAKGRALRGPAATEAAQGLAADALAALGRARAARPRPPAAALPAFAAGWRAGAALKGALAPGFRVEDGPGEESPFRRRAGLLWVAATGRW
jgi:phytoene/squalene synthetase